jgi:hypothetical protein
MERGRFVLGLPESTARPAHPNGALMRVNVLPPFSCHIAG